MRGQYTCSQAYAVQPEVLLLQVLFDVQQAGNEEEKGSDHTKMYVVRQN